MGYIPDLIPKESRVLPDYFDEKTINKTEGKRPANIPLTIISVLLFVAAVLNVGHFFIALILALTGLICTRKGKQMIEKTAKFHLTTVIRAGCCTLLMLFIIPFYFYYSGVDADAAAVKEQQRQIAARFTADSLQKDQIRQDSLNYFLKRAQQETPALGFASLQHARSLLLTNIDQEAYQQARVALDRKSFNLLYAAGHYPAALNTIQQVLASDSSDHEALFNRASCYIRMKKMQLAVYDLYASMHAGNKAAAVLYNKINPLRRHVVGTETLCSDGSTSDATGRGACSWHGGVAQWDHPIYETSRKYQDARDSI